MTTWDFFILPFFHLCLPFREKGTRLQQNKFRAESFFKGLLRVAPTDLHHL